MNKNIPALIFAGVFFFSLSGLAGSLDFATDLFEKNEWELCRRECKRAVLAGTAPAERFELLDALALSRSGAEPLAAVEKFQSIVTNNKDEQVSAIASYEMGRLQWGIGDPESALDSFGFAFQTTTNQSLFLHSACSMFLLLEEHKKLKEENEALISQINTSRENWYAALFAECAKPDPEKSQSQTPNWIVSFYRKQISPAIGDRCTLEPSCSEYFHQASCKHGLKAFPMVADRFFREPEVSNEKKDPVVKQSGQIRYRDPVENHDFWMKKK